MFSLVSRLKYGTLCCSIASLFREEALCIFARLIKDFFFYVDHFKSPYWICYDIASVLCFLVFWPQACGILASWPGIEPALPVLESKVLTTGPPGKSGSSALMSPHPWELIPLSVCSFFTLGGCVWLCWPESQLSSSEKTSVTCWQCLCSSPLFPEHTLEQPWHSALELLARLWKSEMENFTLTCIIPSERQQTKKERYYMIPFILYSGKGRTIGIETGSMVSCE